MKKIIWTIIFLSPILLSNISFIHNPNVMNFFEVNTVFGSWYKLGETIADNGKTWVIIWYLIIALFWTSPFWYAWKGTFIIRWTILRITLIVVSFFIPYLLIAIALIGLWLKS